MKLKNALITCITASSLLAACSFQDGETPYREIVRVPYNFQVKSFIDARETEEAEIISSKAAYPFRKEQIAQSLIHNMNNSLFTSTPAFLDIRMKNYSAIREGKKYFISMLMDISAKNSTNVTLASGSFGCIAEAKESFELGRMLGLVASEGEMIVTDRNNKMWQHVIKQCTHDIAYEFNSQIGSN